MGRYAQSRRRGGGGEPTAALVVPVTIVSVAVLGDNGARITFSAPVAVTVLAPDGGFTIDGTAPDSAADVFGQPTQADVTSAAWFLVPGVSTWAVSAQPNWLVTETAVPQAGGTI